MLLLLPSFQDRLLGHLWVGAAQVELPVAISMNEMLLLQACSGKILPFVADGML